MTDEELRAWQTAGFDDPDEIADWLAARCPTPAVAQRLEQLGFTPAQAALRTRAGAGDYEDTIAGKLARGDLSPDEARRLVTSAFWND
jgi:hypothetical protein